MDPPVVVIRSIKWGKFNSRKRPHSGLPFGATTEALPPTTVYSRLEITFATKWIGSQRYIAN